MCFISTLIVMAIDYRSNLCSKGTSKGYELPCIVAYYCSLDTTKFGNVRMMIYDSVIR